MKGTLIASLAVALTMNFCSHEVSAQDRLLQAAQRVVGRIQSQLPPPQQSWPLQQGTIQNYPVYQQPYYPPTPVWALPQHPLHTTGNRFDGINPYTGGINTRNEQVDNTYFTPGRNESQNNGTRRWVKRPIYNQQGQVVGYQQGWVWNNSITGTQHGQLENVTRNEQGGEHRQIQVMSPGRGK